MSLLDLLVNKLQSTLDRIIAIIPEQSRAVLTPQLLEEKTKVEDMCATFFAEYLFHSPSLIFYWQVREYLHKSLDDAFAANVQIFQYLTPSSQSELKQEIRNEYENIFSKVANLMSADNTVAISLELFKSRLRYKLQTTCILPENVIKKYCPPHGVEGILIMGCLEAIVQDINFAILNLDFLLCYQQALQQTPSTLSNIKQIALIHACIFVDSYNGFLDSIDGQADEFNQAVHTSQLFLVRFSEYIRYWAQEADLTGEIAERYFAEANDLQTRAAPRVALS